MIALEISGGLGNQFFRYAYARTLLEERRAAGMADTLAINYNDIDGHGFAGSLRDFQIVEHEAPACRRLLLKYGSWLQVAAYTAFKYLAHFFKGEGFARFRQKTLARLGIMVSENPDNECKFTPPER